ncbi:MAG: glycoside hydrolase family 88 protein [Clostridia bacterium]|nr:glycoside hydrolase family 88 protein [Clostridia bacterium]
MQRVIKIMSLLLCLALVFGFTGCGEGTKDREKNEKISIKGVCIGTGVSDYTYYINRPTTENDLHGMGAFVLMCAELAR